MTCDENASSVAVLSRLIDVLESNVFAMCWAFLYHVIGLVYHSNYIILLNQYTIRKLIHIYRYALKYITIFYKLFWHIFILNNFPFSEIMISFDSLRHLPNKRSLKRPYIRLLRRWQYHVWNLLRNNYDIFLECVERMHSNYCQLHIKIIRFRFLQHERL